MSSQFYHVNAYGRQAGRGKEGKHTIDSIVAEAERTRGNCPHVTNPKKPIQIFGCSPSEAAELSKIWAESAKDSRGHKLRKDAHCLLAGVVSVPGDFKDSLWEPYKEQTKEYLIQKYGDRLKSIVEHTDEQYRHFHFYVVPGPGERFEDIHEGIKAQNEANPDRGKKNIDKQKVEKQIDRKLGNYAYTSAMRKVQDDFWTKVSSRFGLSRIGPKRKRLTRKEVREQKQRENEIAMVYEQVETLKTDLDKKYSEVKEKLLEKTKAFLEEKQQEYLKQQKELASLQNLTEQEKIAATKEKRSAKDAFKKAQDKIVEANNLIREFSVGTAILNENLLSHEYDGQNVPKPKFMESAQKYSERVYDDLKWIAGCYKEQALKRLPDISSLQVKLDMVQRDNQMKDYELKKTREKLVAFQSLSPEELIRLAKEKEAESRKHSGVQMVKNTGHHR